LLITCEHGGNRIPPELTRLFSGQEALLATHRGYDLGALELAQGLARKLHAPLLAARTSRLVIDLNRSQGHPALYSALTRTLGAAARADLLACHYQPHRRRVFHEIESQLALGRPVVHIAAHSFTPLLDGQVRMADIGLLYDPARSAERSLCEVWQAALRNRLPGIRVRRNYPYRGQGDGLTSALRRLHPDPVYLGVEIELNQAIVLSDPVVFANVRRTLAATLRDALAVCEATH
jgi:predicted N-formylglutamate amidohydrolase